MKKLYREKPHVIENDLKTVRIVFIFLNLVTYYEKLK